MSGKDHKEERTGGRSEQISQSPNSSASQTTTTSSSSFSSAATSHLTQPGDLLTMQNNYDAQEHIARMAGLNGTAFRLHLFGARQEGLAMLSRIGFFSFREEGDDSVPLQPTVSESQEAAPVQDNRELLQAAIRIGSIQHIRKSLTRATQHLTDAGEIRKEAINFFNTACNQMGFTGEPAMRLFRELGSLTNNETIAAASTSYLPTTNETTATTSTSSLTQDNLSELEGQGDDLSRRDRSDSQDSTRSF